MSLLSLFTRSVSSATVLGAHDEVALCNTTASYFTVTLMPARSRIGDRVYVKNVGTGNLTIDAHESETIDGDTTKELALQYDALTLLSDGVRWWIL